MLRCWPLLDLWSWSEDDFLARHEGSPIRRIGYQAWLRNLAVGMGNALRSTVGTDQAQEIRVALVNKRPHVSALVQEHIDWALKS